MIERIDQAAVSGDSEATRCAAHRLLGAARSIGTPRLSDVTKEIEDLGEQGRADDVTKRLSVLRAEADLVTAALQQQIEA